MGFPSPASDYIEKTLSIESICNINANSIIMETSAGYAVVDNSLPCTQGDTVLIQVDGRSEFAKVMGRALITEDGESIEGEALNDVMVAGVVTFFINRVYEGDAPV